MAPLGWGASGWKGSRDAVCSKEGKRGMWSQTVWGLNAGSATHQLTDCPRGT